MHRYLHPEHVIENLTEIIQETLSGRENSDVNEVVNSTHYVLLPFRPQISIYMLNIAAKLPKTVYIIKGTTTLVTEKYCQFWLV